MTSRSVCLLCRSFLLREEASVACAPPPPRLVHTTREILQLSKSARSPPASGNGRAEEERNTESTSPEHQLLQQQQQQSNSAKLSKQALQLLPPCRFPGEIYNIRDSETEEEYSELIGGLLTNRVLGFDVECSPSNNRPILVQLASRELCILWQVSRWSPFPLRLHGILSSPRYLKVSRQDLLPTSNNPRGCVVRLATAHLVTQEPSSPTMQ